MLQFLTINLGFLECDMYKLIFLSNSFKEDWKKIEVLKRKDFLLTFENSFEEGFQKLVRDKYDLFIAEENPFSNSFLIFINQVLNQLKISALKGIVICTKGTEIKEVGPIKKIIFKPFKMEELEDAIISCLNLKKRTSRRYIVRMHLGIGEDKFASFKTCVAINLNKGGMLIETQGNLPIGKVYWWTFQGVKELEGVSIKGKIINEAPMEGFSLNFRYGIKFDEECKEAIKKIEEYLEENF